MSQQFQLNQFAQTPILGDSATVIAFNTLSVQVDSESSATLLPGDAVVLVGGDAYTILVDKATASEIPFGFVLYSVKKERFTAGDALEVGCTGSMIYVQAAASITRGDNLEYVPNADLTIGPKMKLNAGVNPIVAFSVDNASTGDIFRMIVKGQIEFSETIVGGSINNTPIGQSTAAAGAFTALTATTVADAIVALTPSATIALNPALGGEFTLVPGASCTINASSVNALAQEITVVITTSGTSSYTVTFGSNFKSTGTLATGSSSAKVFTLTFKSDGTKYNEISRTTAM